MRTTIQIEANSFIAARGLDLAGAAKELGISRIYLKKILAGDRANPIQRNRIELWLGRPLWSSSEEWAVVKSCAVIQPELLEKSAKQLVSLCGDRGIVPLAPDASRQDLLAALLNQQSTEQNTAPTKA